MFGNQLGHTLASRDSHGLHHHRLGPDEGHETARGQDVQTDGLATDQNFPTWLNRLAIAELPGIFVHLVADLRIDLAFGFHLRQLFPCDVEEEDVGEVLALSGLEVEGAGLDRTQGCEQPLNALFIPAAHTSLLGKERIVALNGAVVRNTYTVEPVSGLKVYGAVEEWSRLYKVSEYSWEARQDTTYGRDRKTGKVNTDYPWGSLKHIHLADLFRGTTLITYPIMTAVWENGEATGEYYDRDQKGAQWLFATLSSIQDETLDFETAKRQYFTNILFFNITREEMARMEAKGEIDPKIKEEVYENARKFRNGETVDPGREVMVDGKPVGMNVLPSDRFMALIGTQKVFVETLSVPGRHRVAQLVAKHNGNLSLTTFVPQS